MARFTCQSSSGCRFRSGVPTLSCSGTSSRLESVERSFPLSHRRANAGTGATCDELCRRGSEPHSHSFAYEFVPPTSTTPSSAAPARASILNLAATAGPLSARLSMGGGHRLSIATPQSAGKKSALRSFPFPRTPAALSPVVPLPQAPRSRLSSCLYSLNTFPLRVPYSKSIALTLFHLSTWPYHSSSHSSACSPWTVLSHSFLSPHLSASLDRATENILLALFFPMDSPPPHPIPHTPRILPW